MINSSFHGVTESETESVILGHFTLILIILCHHVHNHNDSLIGPLHNTLTTLQNKTKTKMWDKVKTDVLLPYFKHDFSNLALVMLSFVELCLFIPVLMTMTYDKAQVK